MLWLNNMNGCIKHYFCSQWQWKWGYTSLPVSPTEPWTPLSCRPWVSTCCLGTKTHIQTACWLKGRLAASSATTTSGNRCRLALWLAWTQQYEEGLSLFGVYCCYVSPPKVAQRELQQVLVLEDDVRFEPSFSRKLVTVMGNVQRLGLEWDLMSVNYCGFYTHFSSLKYLLQYMHIMALECCVISQTHLLLAFLFS